MEKMATVGFEIALSVLKDGGRVRHQGMHSGTYIQMQEPDQNSKMTEPYFYMSTVYNGQSQVFPYTFFPFELLSNDWHIISKDCSDCNIDCSATPENTEEFIIEYPEESIMKFSREDIREFASFLKKLNKFI
jgi:hypothetical protein